MHVMFGKTLGHLARGSTSQIWPKNGHFFDKYLYNDVQELILMHIYIVLRKLLSNPPGGQMVSAIFNVSLKQCVLSMQLLPVLFLY